MYCWAKERLLLCQEWVSGGIKYTKSLPVTHFLRYGLFGQEFFFRAKQGWLKACFTDGSLSPPFWICFFTASGKGVWTRVPRLPSFQASIVFEWHWVNALASSCVERRWLYCLLHSRAVGKRNVNGYYELWASPRRALSRYKVLLSLVLLGALRWWWLELNQLHMPVIYL